MSKNKKDLDWLEYKVSRYDKFTFWIESLWLSRKIGFQLGNFLLVLLWIVMYGPVVAILWIFLFRLSGC